MSGVTLQSGVTYLWMLFLVFVLSLGLGKTLEVYSTTSKRGKESELIYVGGLYREAIRNYYLNSPGAVRKYPESLEDLLRDPRLLVTQRYLRALYLDPMSGKPFDLIMSSEGGIKGVASPDDGEPLKKYGLPFYIENSEQSESYSDWHFTYEGERA